MVLSNIHACYKKLTEAEKRVAQYVLENSQNVVNMTAKELAGKCGVAPSAVIRFCRSVGIEGFSKLKISLAGESGTERSFGNMPAFSRDDSSRIVFEKVFSSGICALQSTLDMIDFKNLEKIIDKLLKAKKILVFGVGTSATIAEDAGYRLSQAGLWVYSYRDILQMSVAAMNMDEGDVAIGISHSGDTKGVVDAMRHAKEAGAFTVAITSFKKSILSSECDFALYAYADEINYPIEAVSARIAHVCIVDALMMCLAGKNYDTFSSRIEKRNKILNEIRYK